MNCAKCNVELEPVSKDRPMRRHNDWTVQYHNALAIEFIGGYGMFDDPVELIWEPRGHQDRTIVICHDCAHEFLDANPWISVVSRRGHSHEIPAESF